MTTQARWFSVFRFAFLCSLGALLISCGSSSSPQLQTIDFTTADGNPYLVGIGTGWGGPEPGWGDWMLGADSALSFNLPDFAGQDIVLDASVRAFLPPPRPHVDVTVSAGQTQVATWSFDYAAYGKGEVGHQIAVIPKALNPSGALIIRFHTADPKSPADLHVSGDARKLTFALVKVTIKKK